MRRSFLQAFVLFLLLLMPVVALWWRLREPAPPADPPAAGETGMAPPGALEEAVTPPPAPSREAVPPARAPAPSLGPEPEWEAVLREARTGKDRLAGLRQVGDALARLPRAEAVERILAYLASGRDQATGLPWALGTEGRLDAAPQLRLWLLDWLGRLAPEDAAAHAAPLLQAGPAGSAEEWALLLRNHAWGRPTAVDFVVGRTRAMLEHAPWRAAPSPGFQDAFDSFVWAEAVEVSPELARLLPASQPQALRQPANLALDRLVRRDPAAVLPRLARIEALAPQPYTRAGYFARAHLGEPVQRRLVEDYFLAGTAGPEEQAYFLALVPNLNRTFSPRLLSQALPTSRVQVLETLDQTAAVLREWSVDPRFADWREELAAALARIEEGR